MLKIVQFLAYVPAEDVEALFDHLKKQLGDAPDPRVVAFYDYFSVNYVGKVTILPGRRGRGHKAVTSRASPLFPISLWNVHSRLSECLSRTNKFTEAWHGAFSATLRSHPFIYSLIDAFNKEQKRTLWSCCEPALYTNHRPNKLQSISAFETCGVTILLKLMRLYLTI